MVYVIPMCTFPLPNGKIRFSQDSQIREVQVRKSYCVPFEPIEWLENLHMAKADLEIGNFVPNFCMYPGPSFLAKCNCGRAEEKSFTSF